MSNIWFYGALGMMLVFFSLAEGCSVHTTQYTCENFSPCTWTKAKKCVLHRRGFNYSSDNGYSLYNTFKPLLSRQVEKAKVPSRRKK